MTVTASEPQATERVPAFVREERSPARVWWRVYLHHLRLVRRQSIVWVVAMVGIGAAMVGVFEDVFPSEAERRAMAATIEGNPAFEALFGRAVELATLEGFVLWRWGGFAVYVVAVWGMFTAGRLLRGAEENGHLELLRAGMITPRGFLDAVMAALITVYLLLAVAIGVTHTALGMDAATAWAFGGALGLLAATFAAAAALACQVVVSRRRALGLVGTVLGVAVVVRVIAAGTGTPEWLWWATPFGWTSHLHEVDGARPVVFVAFAALLVVLLLAAEALASRDLHGGLVGANDHARGRGRPIGGQAGLAARLTVGSMVAWGSGLVGGGFVFGLLAKDFAAAIAEMPGVRELAEQLGAVGFDTPHGIIGAVFASFLALVLTLFAAAQAAAIREEEASWRIEQLLVRPLARVRWLATRTGVAAVAVIVLALAAVMAAMLATTLTGVGLGLSDVLRTAVNLVPISWMFLGIGVAVVGLLPRLTGAITYGLVVAAYLLDLIGAFLELPEAVVELSPFGHLGTVPASGISVGPALLMVAIGGLAAAVGIIAFRRRDLQEA